MINDYREGNANAARAKFISVILRKWLYAAAVLLLMIVNPLAAQETGGEQKLQPFVDFLDREGRDPLALVLDQIKSYDLLIFDDAWHPALEPFQFYQQLVETPAFYEQVKYIFVEVFSVSQQMNLDAYFTAEREDQTLLFPVFQNDFSGEGWPLKTYFDLMHAIYRANQELPEQQRLRVVAVNSPTYWPAIQSPNDLALFRKSLIGNDYTMYRIILDEMGGFGEGRKGIFLTNTRHAYKGIKDKSGQYFWNCGTFFHQWHPGKTYSIRFHHLALSVEKEIVPDAGTARSTAGMERYAYRWVRMADGLWDSAFEARGNRPVAFSLKDNVFGATAYTGNQVHKAAPGQTMYDANDAIIFLAPLESLHNTAMVDIIYTETFKQELARRYRILYNDTQLKQQFERDGVDNLEALVEKNCLARPAALIPQAQTLPPADAWKRPRN